MAPAFSGILILSYKKKKKKTFSELSWNPSFLDPRMRLEPGFESSTLPLSHCALSGLVYTKRIVKGPRTVPWNCSPIRPRGYKTFSVLRSAEHEIILLINVKMPTIVGILTLISMINTTSERLKARNVFICRYLSFYEQLKFRAQLSWAWKKFHNLRAWLLSFYNSLLSEAQDRVYPFQRRSINPIAEQFSWREVVIEGLLKIQYECIYLPVLYCPKFYPNHL